MDVSQSSKTYPYLDIYSFPYKLVSERVLFVLIYNGIKQNNEGPAILMFKHQQTKLLKDALTLLLHPPVAQQ